MRPDDPLLVAAHLADVPDQEVERAMPALIEAASRFYRAGGVLTLRDWAGLSRTSQDAFLAAAGAFRAPDAPTVVPDAARAPTGDVRCAAALHEAVEDLRGALAAGADEVSR